MIPHTFKHAGRRSLAGRRGAFAKGLTVGWLWVWMGAVASASGLGADWAGWRGLERQGCAAEPGPGSWSPTSNVVWRTAIPGQGHSSPVIADERIVVTSAYPDPRVQRVRAATAALLYAGVLAALALGLGVVAHWPPASEPGMTGRVLQPPAVFFGAGLFLLAGLTLVTERHIGFAWTGAEKWILNAVFLIVALALGGGVAPPGSVGRRLFGILALAVAAALSLVSARGTVSFWEPGATRARWIAIALIAVLGVAFLGFRPRRHPGPRNLSVALRRISWFALTAVIVMSVAAACARATGAQNTGLLLDKRAVIGTVLLAAAACAFQRRWRGSAPGLFICHVTLALAWICSVLALIDEARALLPERPTAVLDLLPQWRYGLIGTAVYGAGALAAIGALVLRARAGKAISFPGWGIVLFQAVVAVASLANGVSAFAEDVRPALVRSLVALERRTGQVAWTWTGLRGARESLHPENSAATPTALALNGRFYALFGCGALVCCDRTGRALWVSDQVPHASVYGLSTSPIACGGDIVVASETRTNLARGSYGVTLVNGILFFSRS